MANVLMHELLFVRAVRFSEFADKVSELQSQRERERVTSFSQTTSLIGWGGVASPHLHESYTCTLTEPKQRRGYQPIHSKHNVKSVTNGTTTYRKCSLHTSQLLANSQSNLM